ncbi:MAG TPA: RES family NAD+ phosphorylase [Vitreimonas sp.]|uniref:RES family NAD+ phosphorylase n=1 Tax=Vitreimonas sp. TaxID=3069702 RepID=UPI002D40C2B5|nr:RES family NAD+ phosphorylase [Vitreimonas sp.]HYD87693.1 RES family NAD+ phosphorylase [Vitreimonas sp.]
MSSRIWTPAELRSEFRPYSAIVWRCVEAQHRVSTNRLVDSLAEQAVLERLLEQSKPPLPSEVQSLNYLLATPFRYHPRRPGSRFRRQTERAGVFYAAEDIATAVCELAFYKFLFLADAPDAALPANAIEHTAFSVACAVERALDLTRQPFAGDADVWEALADYAPCQRFADIARQAETQLIRYVSVRDLLRRCNVGLMDPAAFTTPNPITQQSWRVLLKPQLIIAFCDFPRAEYEFPLSMFAADPRLAPLLTASAGNEGNG